MRSPDHTNPDDLIVDRRTLAEVINVDANGALADLIKQNIVVKLDRGQYRLLESVRRFCRHQRQSFKKPATAKRPAADDEDDAGDGDVVIRLRNRSVAAIADGQPHLASDLQAAVAHIKALRADITRWRRLFGPIDRRIHKDF